MEAIKKEVFLAVLIGIIVGITTTLGATGFLKEKFGLFPQKSTSSPLLSPVPSPVAEAPKSNFLTIKNLNEEVFSSPSAKISGKTSSEARILISSESEEILVVPSLDNFEQLINLSLGSNKVVVTSIAGGEAISKELTLFYFPKDQ